MNAATRTAFWTASLPLLLLPSPSPAAATAPSDPAFFDAKIRPILEEHCFDCHGPEKQKNKLRFDTTVGVVRGGESGEPLLHAGLSAESYIIKRVTSKNPKDVMPPKGEKLSTEEIDLIRTWIDAGAMMHGKEQAQASLRITTDHWSFQPVKPPAIPEAASLKAFARSEIDAFVAQKLEAKALSPSPAADRATLIRRLYLVMHGMPPTPEEVHAFLHDTAPDAYARLVDRVLDSPRYGERWARHWMDVVRYADTDGFERNKERKTAYPYRDYIIESLNADKPYSQFLKEQLAGDSLGVDAATGFLVAGPFDSVKSSDKNLTLMQRQDELADIVNTTGTAFLGLTMGCARCHNHKFDPILQKDYYAMQAVFAGVHPGERPLREKGTPETALKLAELKAREDEKNRELDAYRKIAPPFKPVASSGGKRPPVTASLNEESFAPVEAIAVRFTIEATSGSEPCIDEIEVFDTSGKNVALASEGAKASASGTLPGYAIHKLEHVNDGQFGNEHSWISNTKGSGWIQIDFPSPAQIKGVRWSRARDGRHLDRVPIQYKIEAVAPGSGSRKIASSEDRQPFVGKRPADATFANLPPAEAAAAEKLKKEAADLKAKISELSHVSWVGRFDERPAPTHRLYRGEPTQERELVAPDALSVLGTLGLDAQTPDKLRRLKIADWIASAENPLTSRVLVNRLWHYIFGTGIVDTPSDFGLNGGRPTHPELLDWLAADFMSHGWSIKHTLRRILLSATFQQSSAPNDGAARIDADGRFLWRYTPRRLEAEAIRDSMLTVSGAMDLKMGGPGFYLMDVVNENVSHYFPKEKYEASDFRRMVYLVRIRAAQDGVFGAFDCPDGGSVMARRSRSNTPLQALNLFNSSFVTQQSELLSDRLLKQAGLSPAAQASLAFRLFYGRTPDAFEEKNSIAFIGAHGLQSFARSLFNTSEFLFVF
jgi:mono/diheme cytochrome c family protein